MRNISIYIFIIIVLSSCSDWLDVRPIGEIDGEDQISTANGFFEILNGAYITMSQTGLYGKELSFGLVESCAHNHYNNGSEDKPFYTWNYIGDQQMRIDQIWLDAYNTIMNLNFLLDNLEDKQSLFEPDDYLRIKSESMAMRAFLHFDLLRAFSRNYVGNEEQKAIPYINTYRKNIFPHLTASEVIEQIFIDLDEAESLIMENETLTGQSIENIVDDIALDKRRYRFNYYAILGLKARIYQYINNKEQASLYAQKVIDEYGWGWTEESDLNQGYDHNVTFNKECVFMLNVHNLTQDIYQSNFSEARYTTTGGKTEFARDIFEAYTGQVGANDLRYQYTFANDKNGSKAISSKYGYPIDAETFERLPMIRITEMFLIVAENGIQSDFDQSLEIVNDIRAKRKVVKLENTITAEELMNEIVKEFRKETYLEGQVFWLYKRLNKSMIPTMDAFNTEVSIAPGNYIFPYPEAEIEFGNGSRIN